MRASSANCRSLNLRTTYQTIPAAVRTKPSTTSQNKPFMQCMCFGIDHAGWCENRLHFLVRPEGDEFLFAHALIRDGVYASLLHSARRALHGRAAAWYQGRDPVLRAEHLERAKEYRLRGLRPPASAA